MIIRRLSSSLQLITQPQHAALAARIMREWDAAHFPDSPRKASILRAVEQHNLNNYHTMTASSSLRAAATTTNTAMRENTRESIARTPPLPPPTPPLFNNLHEYFQPVFDELDNLNTMLDSHIEEENDRAREKKKK
jgi:Protein of unknown function (DUF3891)